MSALLSPARPANRHQRRRMNKQARHELRKLGTTLEDARAKLHELPAIGAVPLRGEQCPSECTVFGAPGWEPEEVAALCRAVAGDPHRDRFVAVLYRDHKIDMTRGNAIDMTDAKPAAMVVMVETFRREGNHYIADRLLRCPLSSIPLLVFSGVDDVQINEVGVAPMVKGGEC